MVLSWIHLPPKKDNQFVLNRVAQIRSRVQQVQRNHITETSNPADCAYRGISSNTLLNHPLWWGSILVPPVGLGDVTFPVVNGENGETLLTVVKVTSPNPTGSTRIDPVVWSTMVIVT
ncbi:hypothetical protein AVEN_202021-1 [Araneus ventricosus]|uniref:Uncharacterized protein n=1 Tax=Araneus ventricosus TaxID=182803 RepID=A0A4Y2JT69_ARAVE|nr:hypothetical protein AVEN_202021-1 [Araneus ventricosus]